MAKGDSSKVRNYIKGCISIAKAKGQTSFTIKANEVAAALRLYDRYPNISQSMKGMKLQEQAGVTCKVIHDTDSGYGATVEVEYRWE